MCVLHGTRYSQCGDHVEIERIEYCRLVNRKTWTCPQNKHIVREADRICHKHDRSLNDSVNNLFHKMEYYSLETYTPTPGGSAMGGGTPDSDASKSAGEPMEM